MKDNYWLAGGLDSVGDAARTPTIGLVPQTDIPADQPLHPSFPDKRRPAFLSLPRILSANQLSRISRDGGAQKQEQLVQLSLLILG